MLKFLLSGFFKYNIWSTCINGGVGIGKDVHIGGKFLPDDKKLNFGDNNDLVSVQISLLTDNALGDVNYIKLCKY